MANSTDADIEIAKEASAVEIDRENGGMNLTGGEPFMGPQLPASEPFVGPVQPSTPYVPPAQAEQGYGGFPSQAQVDAIVHEVAPADPNPYYGPMSNDPAAYEPAPLADDFGVPAYNPAVDYYEPYRDEYVSTTDGLIPGEDGPDVDAPGEAFKSSKESAYDSAKSEATPATTAAAAAGSQREFDKNAAAKYMAKVSLAPGVYESLAPKEREAVEQKFLSEEVSQQAEVSEDQALAKQSMAAKAPPDMEQMIEAQQKLQLIDDKVTEVERFQSRQKVRAAEDQVDTVSKIEESDAAFDDLKKAMESVGKLKVDRNRWWNSKSTGQKIAAALSLMISGYQHGKAGHGGSAPALKMMMKAIDDDVADQVRAYNSKKEGVAAKQNLYALFRQRGLDHTKAVAATRLQHSRDLDDQMKRINIKKGNFALQQAQDELRRGQLGILSDFQPQNFREKLAADKFDYQQGKDLDKRETSIMGRDGRPLYAKSPKQAVAADKIQADAGIAIKQFDKMTELIDDTNLWDMINPVSSLRNELASNRAAMIGSFRNMVSPGGGVLSDEDRKQITKVNRDTTALFSTSLVKNLTDAAGATKLAQESIQSFKDYTIMRRDQELGTMLRGYTPPAGKRKRIIPGARP